MLQSTSLPGYLLSAYQAWHKDDYGLDAQRHRELASHGQHPRAMFISCCDSRVQPTALFQLKDGDAFVHRNIGSLIPAYSQSGTLVCTPAALEYAVNTLNVADLVVLGHSHCGGIRGCQDMCEGKAPQLEEPESFVGRWIETLRPSYQNVAHIQDVDARARALEHEAILLSLRNLMTFPFVRDAVERGTLTLHGLWHDIGSGELEVYIPQQDTFVALS